MRKPPSIVLKALENRCGYRGAAEFAREIGVTPGYICAVKNGRKRPSDRLLNALGLERVVIYRKRSAA